MPIVAYGKIGRSMPLTLDKCGNLGGDVEMVAVVKQMAERHPDDTFLLLGRNSGETAEEAGLPKNIINPWSEWGWNTQLKAFRAQHNLIGNLQPDEQLKLVECYTSLLKDVITDIDDFVVWIGQHGTTNWPTPGITAKSAGVLTKPQDTSIHYSAPMLLAINLWRDQDPFQREEILLNSDVRNYLKMRDLAWPHQHSTLSQYTYSHQMKHERGNRSLDGASDWVFSKSALINQHGRDLWQSEAQIRYARLEINSLIPGTPFGDLFQYDESWENRDRFGIVINETRSYVNSTKSRLHAMQHWIMPAEPDWVHGQWSAASEEQLGQSFKPIHVMEYPKKLHTIKSTFTTPASGSGWATAKPWEAFAAGVVCFFHPMYDDQNNILADADPDLREWLRVKTPESLKQRIDLLHEDKDTWTHLVRAQRAHFDKAVSDPTYLRMIDERFSR